MENFVFAFLFFAAVCLAPAFLFYLRDRWIWNHGICRQTGQPWIIVPDDGAVRLRSGRIVRRIGSVVGSEEYV